MHIELTKDELEKILNGEPLDISHYDSIYQEGYTPVTISRKAWEPKRKSKFEINILKSEAIFSESWGFGETYSKREVGLLRDNKKDADAALKDIRKYTFLLAFLDEECEGWRDKINIEISYVVLHSISGGDSLCYPIIEVAPHLSISYYNILPVVLPESIAHIVVHALNNKELIL
jgi:hypothetical protein